MDRLPRKRILLITFLILLTIVVLIIESKWTGAGRGPTKQFLIENNSTCWKTETYEIVTECHPCTAFEIASKSQGVCIHTHNKEILKCQTGEIVIRSCDKVAWLEEKRFWTTEIILFIVGGISTFLAHLRQQFLDHKIILKIQRQSAEV